MADAQSRATSPDAGAAEAILNWLDQPIWSCSLTGDRRVHLNAAAEVLLGRSAAEFAEQPDLRFQILHADDRAAARDFERRLGRGDPAEAVLRVTGRDGRTTRLLVRARPARDRHGRVVRVDGVASEAPGPEQARFQTLQASEQRLRRLVEQAPVVSYTVTADAPSRVLYVSPQIEALLGYGPAEFLADPSLRLQLVHPDDHERLFSETARSQATGRPLSVEYRVVARDGRVRWVRDEAVVERHGPRGERVFQGVLIDVTARRAAQDALLASERRYRKLIESMRDAFVQVDMAGRLVDFNPAFVEMTGYEPEELRELTYQQMTPDRWVAMEGEILRDEVVKQGYSRVFEKEYRRKDGTVLPVEIRVFLLQDDQGRPDGMWGIVRDITQRKAAELALERRDAILQAVAFAAERFLAVAEPASGVQDVLDRLGEATGVSRAYIFENWAGGEHAPRCRQRFEWVGPGVVPQIDNPDLQDVPLAEAYARWVEVLGGGGVVWGKVRDFPPSEHDLLRSQDILSLLVAPIFVGRRWWGFVGFDDCQVEREWSPVERDALRVAAGVLGSAVERQRVEDQRR